VKVGDLVDFEFDKTYMGLIIEESDTKVKVLFLDKDIITYRKKDLERLCCYQVISESR
tara:strand:+ start:133 stop:306 length:174 start_codon:yes stop_codon:yes gene_type:complete